MRLPWSSTAAATSKEMGWRERVFWKVSSRLTSRRTHRPPTWVVSQALRGSYSTSCLLPKPPPM